MPTAIRPTTTQRVRGFLGEQGVTSRPWASLDDTYAALYLLLRERRDDEAFWPVVGALLRRIVTDGADGPRRLPAPQAELLRSWDVDALVRDLRRALPGGADDRGGYRRLCGALAAPALGGFLALGVTAAGCDMAPDGDDGPAPAWAEGCALDSGGVVYGALDDSALADDEKSSLCGCLAALGSSTQATLSEMFAECDPEALADLLEGWIAECESAGLPESGAGNAADAAILACDAQAAYKGVSFPAPGR
jgi:hypothetical protein